MNGREEGFAVRLTGLEACGARPKYTEEACRADAPELAGSNQILAVQLTRHNLSEVSGKACQTPRVIERDYEELKQELGLGHCEGRIGVDLIITPLYVSLRMGS